MKNIKILAFIFCLIFSQTLFSQQKEIDSVLNQIKISKKDSNIVHLYEELTLFYLKNGNLEEGFKAAKKGYQYAEKLNFENGKLNLLIRLAEISGKTKGPDEEYKYYIKALKLAEKLKKKNEIITAHYRIGVVFAKKRDFLKAKSNFEIGLQKANEFKIDLPKVSLLRSIGACLVELGQLDSALNYQLKSLDLAQKLNDQRSIGVSYNELGVLYLNMEKTDLALNYFQQAESYLIKSNDFYVLAATYGNMGNLSSIKKDFKSAIVYFNKALDLFKKMQIIDGEITAYKTLAENYAYLGDFKNAYNSHVKFYNLNDSIFGIKTNEKMLELEKKYETEKKEQENKMLQLKNKQDKEKAELNNYKQNLIIGLVSSISILLLIVAVIVGRSLKITKLQKKIIENQKIQVEEHQKEIIDSINYAKRIQYTLLAHENFLNTHLPQHFVFFLPKDIVSGDFYCAIKKDDDLYLAVGDCTGHGVPGAFMSLLNISLLNEAITELNIREPNKVLDFVRDKLIQTMEGSKDGMNAILIRIRKNHIQYAAAHNRPVLIRNNELIELSADKMPVGKGENNNAFTLHELNLEKNDMLYLFTDGYADQFGGPKGKKFKYSRLHKLFLEQHELNISEKRNNLESTFHNWKRDLEQVDDVCVMGIKFE